MNGMLYKLNIDKPTALRICCAVIFSNLCLLLLMDLTNTPTTTLLSLPPDYLEMELKGQLKTPFKKGKEVMILSSSKNILCRHGILQQKLHQSDFDMSQNRDFSIAVAANCLAKLIDAKNPLIIPYRQQLSIRETKTKGKTREIFY